MKRILIIDDEPRISELYTVLLWEEGYEAKYALNAREATNLLIRENFDLVLLDISMAKVDGKIMYEVIREYDRNMKVIVSSVYPIEDQVQIISGASAYHNKSQGVDILITKIKEILDGGDV
jgi:DNA-binding NtrC family response regulator